MKKLSFIGAGNVAWNLAHAFDLAGMTIHEVYAQSEDSAKNLAEKFGAFYSTDVSKLDASADCVILAISDHAIHEVLDSIKKIPSFFAHTSGAVPVEALIERHMKGGVLYPFQSLSKDSIQNMEAVPFLIEGNDRHSAQKLAHLAEAISSKVHYMDSDDRMHVHIAGVLANNFGNHLFTLARDFLRKNNLPENLVTPLMTGMLSKYKEHPPENLQTGPAVRFDLETIKKHEAAISDADLLTIYQVLTKSIEKRHPKN